MADIKSLAEKRGTLLYFNPSDLHVKPGLNNRDENSDENEAHIRFLADDIKIHGVRQPLTIFQEDDTVYVADGHCRLAAVNLLEQEGFKVGVVPCLPEPRGTNDADRVLNQLIYNSGKPFTVLEKARTLQKAIAMGKSTKDVAASTGLSVSYINQQVKFLEAPQEVHQLVEEGKVSASMAAKVIRQRGKREGAQAIREAVEQAETTGARRATASNLKPEDELWARVQDWVRQNTKRPKGIKDADLLVVLGMLKEP